ncbi:MAG TPA: tetratricopeptide repeat protein [Allosphingosinicella sp.]|nr:tetratricopeptide repeat protein [Allosphingosinicella sp.]
MAAPTPSSSRISAATIALGTAALLAAGAVGIAVFRPNDATETPPADAAAGNSAAGQPTGSVEDMIAGLEERLRQDPDNHEGWHLLGLALRESGRFDQAESAFRRATELAPRNPDYAAYRAEAVLLAGGDDGRAEAERLFRRVLELQPGNPQARYYLATMKDMAGDHRGAVDELLALLREAPPDAPWEAQVREATTAIARQNGIDIAGRLPPPRQPAAAATAAIPGPTREQMEAARAIPPGEQDAMVRGMVDRLASRLRQNPRDADGWIRLMRSRMVLNDRDAAGAALRSALAAFAGDSATQQRLRGAAAELGVPAG